MKSHSEWPSVCRCLPNGELARKLVISRLNFKEMSGLYESVSSATSGTIDSKALQVGLSFTAPMIVGSCKLRL
jgi:hypothetical protein